MSDLEKNPNAIPEIDLSAVKNLDAAEKIDPTMKETVKESSKKKKNRKSKFNFGTVETIPLPSRGILYRNITEDEDILNGQIKMRPMTVKEEEILSTERFIREGNVTRIILERCIESDIDAKDILLFDSNFLLFYLRMISYGDEYTFEIKSTEDVARRKFSHTIKISELAFEELPEDVKEPIITKLPVSGYTVESVLPRMYHSEEIQKRENNRKKSTSDSDKRFLTNMVLTTLRILDEDKDEVPEADWEEFYEALPGKDIAELRENTSFSTGVDEIEGIVCPYTGRDMDISIPVGADFFRF